MFGPLSFSSNSENGESETSVKSSCILCDVQFDVTTDREPFSAHLLDVHSLTIKDSDCIIDLAGYVKYWREKFKSSSYKEVCSGGKKGELGPPYVLSDALAEDKELRLKLNKQSLEGALEQQRLEREDVQFNKKCLLCRETPGPTRANYLTHLSAAHNLQLGKPDNLVYVDRYLALVQNKIDSLVCIFCEKVFKERGVLKEHMRKKLHKRVNPRNPAYDCFYISNYLAPGRTNKKLRERKRRMSPDEDDDCDWSDWREESGEPVVCLFCTEASPTWDSALLHLSQQHSFHFKQLTSELTFYDQIKLVNFIRRQVYRNQCVRCDKVASDRTELLTHLKQENHFSLPSRDKWDQPEYFFPTYENDGFLYYLDDCSDDTAQKDDTCRDMSEVLKFKGNSDKLLPCLFCEYTDKVGESMLEHMFDQHDFDYIEYTRPLDFLQRVKLINYTRCQLSNGCCMECSQKFDSLKSLVEHMKELRHYSTPPESLWNQDKYSWSSDVWKVSKDQHDSAVDYLYALESMEDMQKEVKIEEEVKGGCFSDAEEEDGGPLRCLFCAFEATSWSQALDHLKTSHRFDYVHLTSQLSFYDQVKMVSYIRKRVKKKCCPVCGEEKSSESQLLEHMDSSSHFSLPDKHLWDHSQFYPASLSGDTFLSELNVHHATDTLTATHPSNDNKETEEKADSDSSDWGDWDEEMKIEVRCLLCPHVSQSWPDVHSHMKETHNFSYLSLASSLPFYDQVKLVNYLRSEVASNRCFYCSTQFESNDALLGHCKSQQHCTALPQKQLWNQEKFMRPFMENDGFLGHIDDGESDDEF